MCAENLRSADQLRERFRPEFLNRIDEIVEFKPLSRDQIAEIVELQLERLRVFQQLPEWEQIMQGMRVMAERVVRGAQSEDGAVTGFDAEVDAMLAKRRWLLDRQEKR